MRKCILLALTFAYLPLSANYGPCGPCDPFAGFFLGANGGISINTADTLMFSDVLYSNGQNPPLEISETYLIENKVYQFRPWGEVFGGWGWQFCWLYLGGRLGVNFSKYDPKANFEAVLIPATTGDSISFQENQLKTEFDRTEYTFDFKPGLVFCNRTMVFGLIGGAYNKQRLRGKALYSEGTFPPVVITGTDLIEIDMSRHACAWRGGVGIEHLISPCISLNLTYVYSYYWDLKGGATIETPTAALFYQAIFETQASRQVASMGITVYF